MRKRIIKKALVTRATVFVESVKQISVYHTEKKFFLWPITREIGIDIYFLGKGSQRDTLYQGDCAKRLRSPGC